MSSWKSHPIADAKDGKVLWWSDRDNNGIITDIYNNEHYFDISVVITSSGKFKNDDPVTFVPVRLSCGTLCAREVKKK